MSGASDATAKLLVDIGVPLAAIGKAATTVRDVRNLLHTADDIMPAMGYAANLALACEALSVAAKEAERAARDAVAAAMSEIGCTAFRTDTHTISISDGRTSVDVIDAAAVPPEMMTEPKPAPDKKKIGQFLKKNAVNWARVVTGGPILTIRNSET